MKRFRVAAVLMIIHGAVEIIGIVMLLPLLKGYDYSSFGFSLPYLQDNLVQVGIMGAIFGILRIVGAVGVLKNRQWGMALSLIMCVTTLILMIFMLPMGIADGILASVALILLLKTYFGNKKII
jgi:hypothetical protein